VLLVSVLGIWGLIGYKILNAVNPDQLELDIASVDSSFKPKVTVQKDTFSIQTTKRDPFLGTLTKKNNTNIRSKNTKPSKLKKDTYPIITYQGLVKKQNSLNQIFTVSVNNQQYLLKKGQTIDSVTLIKGNFKAIFMRYKGVVKTFSIQ